MFSRECFDGASKGNSVGGIMTKGFEAWSDFQKDKVWFKRYQRFQKMEIKRIGKENVYDKLKDPQIEKYRELVAWIEKKEVLLVKRGDYKQSQVSKKFYLC